MAASDPVSDALTKIRNASRAKHATVDVKPSRLTERILDVLRREGFIRTYKVVGEEPAVRRCRVYLKYASRGPAIEQIVRVSRAGVRMYRGYATLPRVRAGMGVAIISTSQGVMSDREAYRKRIGGEVLCFIW
ncbi:MAG TPA: 30S ribosomal protein S8 [bacterium]